MMTIRGVKSRAYPSRALSGSLAGLATAGLLAVGTVGCDDPYAIDWTESPDTAMIYSLARPELNLPSAFDFVGKVPLRVEAPLSTGQWDLALDTQDGELVFLPPGAMGISSSSRVTRIPNTTWDDVIQAPSDSLLYSRDEPVPVRSGDIYVLRTHVTRGIWGTSCVYFGRIKPLEIQVAEGYLRFQYDFSPVCNSLRLIPD
jgi:hypothetical protein